MKNMIILVGALAILSACSPPASETNRKQIGSSEVFFEESQKFNDQHEYEEYISTNRALQKIENLDFNPKLKQGTSETRHYKALSTSGKIMEYDFTRTLLKKKGKYHLVKLSINNLENITARETPIEEVVVASQPPHPPYDWVESEKLSKFFETSNLYFDSNDCHIESIENGTNNAQYHRGQYSSLRGQKVEAVRTMIESKGRIICDDKDMGIGTVYETEIIALKPLSSSLNNANQSLYKESKFTVNGKVVAHMSEALVNYQR